MKHTKLSQAIAILTAAFILGGCITSRNTAFLRDMKYEIPYEMQNAPEVTLQADDRLTIAVICADPQLSAPFNNTILLTDQVAGDVGGQSPLSYTVDSDGNIDFPILGSLHVGGMTLREVERTIASLLIARGYIKEPTVQARITNFTISVIGAEHMRINVTDEKYSLLNLVAQISRNTTLGLKIRDVMVIRQEGNCRVAHKVNMQSVKMFDSPYFYLQQGDIVYIKPRILGVHQDIRTVLTSAASLLSTYALVLSIINLAKTIK